MHTVVRLLGSAAMALALDTTGSAATPSTPGAAPPLADWPKLEFAFEERVTLAPAVVLGETAFGQRQYIAISGGTVAGPKLRGTVVPGGWDFQLRLANGCSTLTADYFLRAEDGTIIHVLNQGMLCPPAVAGAERSFFRPVFEAPKGPHDWLTRGSFVATLEIEPPAQPAAPGAAASLNAIRLRFYQIK